MVCIVRLGGSGMDWWVPEIRMLHGVRLRRALMSFSVGDIVECWGIEVRRVHGTRFRQMMIIDVQQMVKM